MLRPPLLLEPLAPLRCRSLLSLVRVVVVVADLGVLQPPHAPLPRLVPSRVARGL